MSEREREKKDEAKEKQRKSERQKERWRKANNKQRKRRREKREKPGTWQLKVLLKFFNWSFCWQKLPLRRKKFQYNGSMTELSVHRERSPGGPGDFEMELIRLVRLIIKPKVS